MTVAYSLACMIHTHHLIVWNLFLWVWRFGAIKTMAPPQRVPSSQFPFQKILKQFHILHLNYNIRIHANNIDRVLTTKTNASTKKSDVIKVPGWIQPDTKVQFLRDGEYHKGYLSFDPSSGWSFEIQKRNGMVNWSESLPYFISKWRAYFDDATIIPT